MPTTDMRIVFGDDGSPSSDEAWAWLTQHRWAGASVDVLTATDPGVRPAQTEPGADDATEWTPATPREPGADAGLGRTRHLIADTDPRIALSAQVDADLMVIGRGDLGRRFARVMGSTAAWLVHHPPAPLAIISRRGPTRRVLACVDGSDDSTDSLDRFLRLPLAQDVELTVLSVYDGWADCTTALETAEKLVEAHGRRATFVEGRGKAVPTILELADEGAIDLIVLGAKGLSGWDWLKVGSTAAAVASHASTNLLIGGPVA